MFDLINKMTNKLPAVTVRSKREKGKYGQPHLVLLNDVTEEAPASYAQFQIMIPYREGRDWITWVDVDGNLVIYGDRLNARRWILLSEVPKEVISFLQLNTDLDWSKALS